MRRFVFNKIEAMCLIYDYTIIHKMKSFILFTRSQVAEGVYSFTMSGLPKNEMSKVFNNILMDSYLISLLVRYARSPEEDISEQCVFKKFAQECFSVRYLTDKKLNDAIDTIMQFAPTLTAEMDKLLERAGGIKSVYLRMSERIAQNIPRPMLDGDEWMAGEDGTGRDEGGGFYFITRNLSPVTYLRTEEVLMESISTIAKTDTLGPIPTEIKKILGHKAKEVQGWLEDLSADALMRFIASRTADNILTWEQSKEKLRRKSQEQ